MSALRQLKIAHFRGAVRPFSLPFEKNKKLTVIYGENGSGKSTICDALEFIAQGKVGSLENRGLGQTVRFWPSLNMGAGDVSVSLESTDGVCDATMTKSGEVLVVPQESRPSVEVFRKTQILSLIEAKPSERYAAISRFIDVSGIEASEGAVRDLLRDLKRKQEVVMAESAQNEESIRQFWNEAGAPGEDPFAWANMECARNIDDFEAESAALNALQAAFGRLVEIPDVLRAAQQALRASQTAEAGALKALEDHLQSAAKDAGEVAGLLRAAQDFLAKTPEPHACPLCESSSHIANLSRRVQQRLSAFSALQTAQSNTQAARQNVILAEQQLELARNRAREEVVRLQQILSEFAWPRDIRLPPQPIPTSAGALADWLAASVDLPGEWRKDEVARLDTKRFIGTLQRAVTTWRDTTGARRELDILIPRLERVLKIMMEERRRFTDDMLASISGEAARLYEVVHPGEGLHRISLELDPKKRASLEIGASFCGRSTRPQAYFSDSHLDTLGLCVFIALSAQDDPANTIIVLDDVLASVDEPHADRLIELLHSEAARFRHCIITTHDRSWIDRRRSKSKDSPYQVIELRRWTPETGIQSAD